MVTIFSSMPSMQIGGFGFIIMNIGKFILSINAKTRISNKMYDNVGATYQDEGELIIRLIQKGFTKIEDARGKGCLVSGMPSLAPQLACFGTEKVSATPDNIVKAIRWCQNNPEFMESSEGV